MIKGTRISVPFIVRFLRDGATAEEIVGLYPHLTLASVHDAISYYFDHQSEIDTIIAESTPERLAEKYGYETRDGKITFKST